MPRRRREPVPQQGAFFYTLPPGTEIRVLDPNEIPISNAWLYPLLGREPSDEGIIVGPGTDNDVHLTFANPTAICKILLNGELNDVTITSTRPDGSVTILVVEVRHRGVWVSDLFNPEPVLGIRIAAAERSKITQIELSKAVMPGVPLSLETVRVGLYSNLDEAHHHVPPARSPIIPIDICVPDRSEAVRVPTELEVLERIIRDNTVPVELRARALGRLTGEETARRLIESEISNAEVLRPFSSSLPSLVAQHEADRRNRPEDADGDDDTDVVESDSVSALHRGEARRRNMAIGHNAPLDDSLFTDPISQNIYRREFRTIEMGQVVENTLGIQSSCARYDIPNGIDFMFAPDQKPLMRIFPAHDTTPPDGWEGRMNVRFCLWDATQNMRRGILYEGHYEDFLKPQTPEDNHYQPQVGRIRATPGDVITVLLESPDVVIDPTRTRFRLQTWLLIRMRKRRVRK